MSYLIFGIVVLFLSILMWLRPQWMLPILIIVAPLQRFSIYISSIGLSLKFLVILIPIAFLMLALKKRVVFDRRFLIFGGAVFLGILISLIGSINLFRTASVLGFMGLAFLFVVVIDSCVENKKSFLLGVNSLILSGFIVALIGIIQFVSFSVFGNATSYIETVFPSKTISVEEFVYDVNDVTLLRPSSTFVDVNLTSGFLGITLFLSTVSFLVCVVKNDSLVPVVGKGGIFLVILVAFIMTISRSAFLGFGIAAFIWVILNFRALLNKKIIVIFSTLIIFTALYVLAFDTPIDALGRRFLQTFFEEDTTGSTQEHLRFASGAIEIFKLHPVMGVGAGNFEEYYLKEIDPNEDTAYTYNVFAGFLAETGLIGFFSQLSLMGFIIYSGFHSFQEYLKKKDLSFSMYASVLVCGFIGILLANLFYAYYILLFVWLLVGLIISSNNTNLIRNET